jgi:hypothetical protein
MKAKIASLITGAGAAACMALAGCGGGSDNGGMSTSTPAIPMNLDTAQVLAIAKTKASETAEPFQVNGGAVVVTPVGDETSEPIAVDGP